MQYSCEVVACVGIVSIALGMLLGLLLRSEEETPECVRGARTYVRQGLQVAFDGFLRFANRAGGLEGGAQHDGLAIGDAALNAARAVGPRTHPAVFGAEGIVMLRTREQSPGKA